MQTVKIRFKLPGVPQRDGMPVAGVGIGFLLSSSNLQDGICFCSEGRNSIFQDQIMTVSSLSSRALIPDPKH